MYNEEHCFTRKMLNLHISVFIKSCEIFLLNCDIAWEIEIISIATNGQYFFLHYKITKDQNHKLVILYYLIASYLMWHHWGSAAKY